MAGGADRVGGGLHATARPFALQPVSPALNKRLSAELDAKWVNAAAAIGAAAAAGAGAGAGRAAVAPVPTNCGVVVGQYPGTRTEHLVWKAFICTEPDAQAGPLHELLIRIPPTYPFKAPIVEFESPMDDPAFKRSTAIDADPLPPSWSPVMSMLQLTLNLRNALISRQKSGTARGT